MSRNPAYLFTTKAPHLTHERGISELEGYVILENLEDLRARLRKRQDRDIRQALKRLGQLEQGELSDLIRDGVRHELLIRGVLDGRSKVAGNHTQSAE